jgi:hypothetical protein
MAEADRHPMNMFTVLVGVTSKGRKGTSWGQISRLFALTDPSWASKDHVTSGLSSGEGLIWAVRDSSLSDETVCGVSDKRLLVLESEFASSLKVMSRDGSTLSPVIRQAWDTGNLRSLTKNSPASATGAHISIIGHITKDELIRYLDATESANGLGNRFLWVCVKRSKLLPEGGNLQEDILRTLSERLGKAIRFAQQCGLLQRDEEARALWAAVYPALSEGSPGLFGSLTSRAEAQVVRLSCIYALLDMSYVVKAVHLRAALAVWSYCEASTRYIFGDSTGDPVADGILRALRTHSEGMTRTDIRDLFQRNKSSAQIERALNLLLERNLAKLVPAKNNAGRQEERWTATTKTTYTI